jgi:hypothetical protein
MPVRVTRITGISPSLPYPDIEKIIYYIIRGSLSAWLKISPVEVRQNVILMPGGP